MSGESAVEKVAGAARGRGRRLGRRGAGRDGPAGGLGLGAADSRGLARGEGLQLSLDFDTVSQGARSRRRRGRAAAAPGVGTDGATATPGAIRRPAHGARGDDRQPGADRRGRRRPTCPASRAGWPSRPSSARRSCPTTRGRAAGSALAFAVAGATAGSSSAYGAEAADGLRHMVEARNIPIVAHEVKPILVPRFADDPSAHRRAGRLRHPDRGLPPQRRASVAVDRRRRRRAARPRPAAAEGAAAGHRAGLEALSALAVRDPLARSLQEEGLDRLFREIELPLIPVLARMEADGVGVDLEALGRARSRVRRRDQPARGGDLRRGRPPVHDRLAEAAGRDPVRGAAAAEGPQDQDRLLDRRVGPRGADRRAPGRPADPRLADLHEAALDLRRGAADADRRRRPAAHDVPPGRRGDGPPLLVRPEPPEHPDPDAARPAHPARVRRRLAGHGPGRRRLLPDRAADHRPRRRRRAPQGRVRAQGGHPPRDRGARAPQGARGRSPRTSGRWPRWSTSGSPTG